MKTILLPTDFSKNSINAINYAVELFKNEVCDFYILNVQKASSFISDDMMLVSSSTTIYNTLVDAAKKSISNIISGVEGKHKNEKHQFHSIVDYDNFIDSINQISEKHQIDLIIMGTKGATGLQKVIFGSNAVHVMQRCKPPVLVIPNACNFIVPSKIVFATNFQPHSLAVLKPLKNIITLYDSQLSILHIADENSIDENLSDNIDFFNENFKDSINEYIDANGKDIYNVVSDYIIRNNIKMLVTVSKQHSFLERLFTKFPEETFAFNITIPFLVMHNN